MHGNLASVIWFYIAGWGKIIGASSKDEVLFLEGCTAS
jgi:hypothetical protein